MEGVRFGVRRGVEPLRHVLGRALQGRGVSHRLGRTLPPGVWEAAVGKALAARAQATSLTAGVLHVLVEDHRWRDQLDAARVFVIDRLNQKLGRAAVRELQFGLAHAGALKPSRVRAGLELRAPYPVCETAVLGGAALEGELKDALLRAAGAAARRAARTPA